jgi:hypothetical protein
VGAIRGSAIKNVTNGVKQNPPIRRARVGPLAKRPRKVGRARFSERFIAVIQRNIPKERILSIHDGDTSFSQLTTDRLSNFQIEPFDIDLKQCPKPIAFVFPVGSKFPGEYSFGFQIVSADSGDTGARDSDGDPVDTILLFWGLFTKPGHAAPSEWKDQWRQIVEKVLRKVSIDMAEETPDTTFRVGILPMPLWMSVERFHPQALLRTEF